MSAPPPNDDRTGRPAATGTDPLRVLAAAPVGIFETDANGLCTFVNDRWCEFAGMDRDAALGVGWAAAVHPDDRSRITSSWYEAARAGRPFQSEVRYQRPDGSTIWLSASSSTITDPDGTVVAHIGTVTDITDAVAVREALADEQRFTEATLEIAGSLVCVFDPTGRFLRFNRACEEVSGYSHEEIIGRPFYDFLIPTGEIEGVRSALRRLRAGDPPAPNTNHWVTKAGALRMISWSNTCFFDDAGELTHIVSTGTDITDEHRANEALHGIEAIGPMLASQGVTTETLAAILDVLAERMGYAYLALFVREGDTLRIGAQRGYADLDHTLDPEVGIIGRVFRTREPALVGDVHLDPDYVVGHADVMSEIAVPLLIGSEVIGVLSIESTVEAPLRSADLRLAQTVAERVAAALALGREQLALRERVRLFDALTDFARTANSMLDSERIHAALAAAIADVVPLDSVSLVVLDRTTGTYVVRAVTGALDGAAVGRSVGPGQGASGRAIADRALVVVDLDRASWAPAFRDVHPARTLRCASIPLMREGAVLGVIALYRTMDQPAFSPLECEVLSLVGEQTALALVNAHLLEEVSELAIRDGLTGLYNRRHFDAAIDRVIAGWARGRGTRPPIAAIMFDLDHFGRFNEDHGHQAGDGVLRAFAGILLARFRASDLVARFGGEEFVAILEGSSLEDAVRVAEEVRANLEQLTFPGADGSVLRATVSAGCSALDEELPTREALLRAADVGLFMAKRSGRNRVVAA